MTLFPWGTASPPVTLTCLRAGNGVVAGSRGVQPIPRSESDSGGVLSVRVGHLWLDFGHGWYGWDWVGVALLDVGGGLKLGTGRYLLLV